MNSFGRIFRINIYGESHGKSVGVVIDGCPPGISVSEEDFTEDLLRRKSGAKGTTPRIESDKPILLSGIFNNKTTGAPINIMFENRNTKSKDYENLKKIPRPGHSDFVALKKYKGFNDIRGGGHFSGRLTLGLIAAGVIAKKIVDKASFNAKLISVGKEGSSDIEKTIEKAIMEQDSIGGIIECRIDNVPVGLGEPFFDSVESRISHIVFSIPGIRGIEFGSGFDSARMTGSEHNDLILDISGKTVSNNAGGINGGISNGNEIVFRVAVKPTSSISRAQETVNLESGKTESLIIEGRHDVCFALRVPVIVEAVSAIVLADLIQM
jgi:chorismate synthase